MVTSHALPSVAGGVAGVAWLGDLALAGAAAAGGHDGDGFGGVGGVFFWSREMGSSLCFLFLLLKEDGIVDVVAFAL